MPNLPSIPFPRLDIFRYSLPLHRSMPEGGGHTRFGWLIRAVDAEGHVGWGDVAPLPGRGQDSHFDIGVALSRFRRETWTCSATDIMNAMRTLPPPALFGVEMALADLDAGVYNETLIHDLSMPASAKIHLCALISEETPDAAIAAAIQAKVEGYRAIKVKVGGRAPEEDVDLVRSLRAALGPGIELRCDANRAWNFEKAMVFAKGVLDYDPAYVEEPLRDPSRLDAWTEAGGIPYALDETLTEGYDRSWDDFAHVSAVVLKPSMLGASGTLMLARMVHERGVRSVMSAAFESGVGLAAVAALAATLPEPRSIAGLDTYRWLAADVLESPLPLPAPILDVREAIALARRVNLNTLEPFDE